ncbi:MAG: LEA type 2 family protein [Flammeovirgaceae bacterium]
MKKAFFLVTALCILAACSSPKQPEIKRIEHIKVISFTGQEITLEAKAILHNPNPIALELAGAAIDVSVNDIQAAKINDLQPTELKANGETKVPLRVSFPTNKVLKLDNLGDLLNMATKRKAKVAYKGDLQVKAVGITFNVPVEKEQEVVLK